jgi:alkylhydroperoxidase family enzyme
MAFITVIPVAQATGEVRGMYEKTQAAHGFVPNYAKVFSHRPQVLAAWSGLLGSIRANLDTRRYELITLAAARAIRHSYCMLAKDTPTAGLAPADVAMMAFAEAIARDASTISAADVRALREHGFTDAQIFDIAATAAARCFFSKLTDALGAEPDAVFAELEDELKRQLTPGRAISQQAPEKLA